jgi:hypothetical protein
MVCLNFEAWVGGDPHISTFDNLTYTFNGNGKFVLSRANDSSFEIQASTKMIRNANNPNLTSSVFDGFAMRTNSSLIFQIDLADSETKNPYLGF